MKPFEPSAQQSQGIPRPSSSFRKKRMLLVEEESTTRFMLLNQLSKAGLDVELASTGAIALKKLTEEHVDAIVIDAALSDVKALDLIKEIRRKKKFEGTPIFVCCNAATLDAWQRRGTKAGATKVFDRGTVPAEDIVADIVLQIGAPIKG